MPYLAHFGLEEHPFTLTPDVEYFFPTEEHANIIASVEFALRRDTGIIKVVGDVGTGKTLLCRLLIKKLIDTEAVAYINAPRASANSILLGVCHEFGIEDADNPDTAYTALNRFLVEEHAKGRLAVVVVDEAQHLGREGLELVRLISNLETEKSKLLQIVLFGQTELDELLSDPSMRQLNQRIAFSLSTKPLDVNESKAYINHRIRVSRRPGVEYDVFGRRAVELLARSCGGVPRVINIVADKSLLAAFADGAAVVQPAHVAEALKESGTLVRPVTRNRRNFGWLATRVASYFGAAFAVALLAIAVAAVFPGSGIGHRLHAAWQIAGGNATPGTQAPRSTDAPREAAASTAPAPAPTAPSAGVAPAPVDSQASAPVAAAPTQDVSQAPAQAKQNASEAPPPSQETAHPAAIAPTQAEAKAEIAAAPPVPASPISSTPPTASATSANSPAAVTTPAGAAASKAASTPQPDRWIGASETSAEKTLRLRHKGRSRAIATKKNPHSAPARATARTESALFAMPIPPTATGATTPGQSPQPGPAAAAGQPNH
jgi:MSHA biogenesis protein MshM